MKGAFETALVLMFGMLFLVMGMDYVGVVMANNQARRLAENSLAILEHQNRLDENVRALIQEAPIPCKACTLSLEPHSTMSERIWVIVRYPVSLAHIGYRNQAEVRLLSRPLG